MDEATGTAEMSPLWMWSRGVSKGLPPFWSPSTALTLKIRCPPLGGLPLSATGVCPATVIVGHPVAPAHRM